MGSMTASTAGAISVVILHHDAATAAATLPWPQAVVQLVFGGIGAIVCASLIWRRKGADSWMAGVLLVLFIAILVITIVELCLG